MLKENLIIAEPTQTAEYCMVLLHGLGANGSDLEPLARAITKSSTLNIRFVIPSAKVRPITVNAGFEMSAWYDIQQMLPRRKVDMAQLDHSVEQVIALIEEQVAQGINSEKIFIAGFSQGGAVAYQAMAQYQADIAGLLIMSSYIASRRRITEQVTNATLPILIQHGSHDDVVPEQFALDAKSFLLEQGYEPRFESFPMDHSICPAQIRSIANWLEEITTN
ncbi:PE-PPE domain-containing protein [Alginatibacterium sediminis]|uniref:PE-PPE domain-containing protein n=1 Tax=Alginatibacterium sediminis TaxID=2164068 RepID=A0A420E6N8_9ALTE|nr:alpha/beta hydrolase [Alginatibacterium sediminis]RKF13327.1 PE-PPE domain-containing protein [Alginatibacterium sediminis]